MRNSSDQINSYSNRLDRFHALSEEERIELAISLIRRTHVREDALGVLRVSFPATSDEMLKSAAYHAYAELPRALINVVAWLEFILRDRVHEFHSGLVFDALYHLYNWLQFDALVLYGEQELLDSLNEIGNCLEIDDKEGIRGILKDLKERFDGNVDPPSIEC